MKNILLKLSVTLIGILILGSLKNIGAQELTAQEIIDNANDLNDLNNNLQYFLFS